VAAAAAVAGAAAVAEIEEMVWASKQKGELRMLVLLVVMSHSDDS